MKKQHKFKAIVSELIFYGILISMVVAVIAISGANSKGPRVYGGYSAFVVLTGSMEAVIPKGSLVITKDTDPQDLRVGDDITYMVSESTTVTHRIIEIEENVETAEYTFRTQGVMNSMPDNEPVAAVNVVGKVIWHNKALGTIISYGQDNWPLLIFFIAVFLIFLKLVEIILRKEEPVRVQTEKTEQTDEEILEIIEL